MAVATVPFEDGRRAGLLRGILVSAGFVDVKLRRCDLPFKAGNDIDEAIELTMDLGPAGEIVRLQGERAAHLHEPIRQALREGMAEQSLRAVVPWTASAVGRSRRSLGRAPKSLRPGAGRRSRAAAERAYARP